MVNFTEKLRKATILIAIFLIGTISYAQKVNPSYITNGVYYGEITPGKDFQAIKDWKDFEKQKADAKALMRELEAERNPDMKNKLYPEGSNDLPQPLDPILQSAAKSMSVAPEIVHTFAGQNSTALPPDCNGAIGPNHYVQTINLTYTVYNRTGTLLAGPFNLNSLFTGVTGANCNDGDPIILYDEQADRWLAAEFSLCNANELMLVAVSTTSDPTGSWNRWSFDVDDTPDYMKFGVWRDGYYMATNTYGGKDVYAFERDAMVAGAASPQMVGFDNPARPNSGFHCIMPFDNDGAFAPSGTPGQFITINDNIWGGGSDALWIYELDVNWSAPASSTFGRTQVLTVPTFDSNFGASMDNITQKGTTQKLDAINTILMYRAQYLNFGSYQALVCCHTVDVDGTDHAGVRWYELRNTGSGWTVRQNGTYAPDARSRWMAGISMNKRNEIGLAYSISGSTEYPGLRFTGQTATEYAAASGAFDIDETIIATGTSYQANYNRWGDYAGMQIDPNDSTTFWFTSEYGKTTVTKGTQVIAFKFPDLAAPPFVDFEGSPMVIAEGGSVDFTDLSSNLPTSWSWSFPGGSPSTSTQQNPSNIIYSVNGVYDVTLTATNANGSNVLTKTGYITVSDQGCGEIIFSEDFEGVTTPALPAGWATSGACAVDFYTGDATAANAGGYWPVPAHGIFAMTNDDVYNCDKSADYLNLPVQDFTGMNGLELSFACYDDGAYGGGPNSVELNINGAGWNSIYNITQATAWQSISIPLTGCDNTPNIQIRFHYTDAATWATGMAIDDVVINKMHSNNNTLGAINAVTNYTSIPYMQAPTLSFGANIKNNGFNNSTGVHLNLDISGADTWNGTSPSTTLNVGTESAFAVSSTYVPSNIGTYTLTYTAEQDSTDCTPLDNTAILVDEIIVSDTVYARDNGDAAFQLSSSSYGFTGLNYQCAVSYDVLATDVANSITLGVGPGTPVGTVVQGRIWNDNAGPNTILRQTFSYTITADDQFEFITLPLTASLSLAPGKYHVGFAADTNFVILANDGPFDAGSLWMYDDAGAAWYSDADGLAEVYFVRLNFAYNPPPYDLSLDGVAFTDYSQTPLSQVDPINFYGLMANNGDNNQTNSKFRVTITGSGSFVDSSDVVSLLLPGLDTVVSTVNSYLPAGGNYNVLFETVSDQSALDNAPQNNNMNARFSISDTTYARDHGEFDGGGRYNVGVSYELGNLFEITHGRRASSVSVYLHPVTDAGSEIKAFVYNSDLLTAIDSSAAYTIQAGDINNGFLTLPLLNRQTLAPDYYYAVIMQTTTGDTVAIADGSDFVQATGEAVFRDTARTGTWFSLSYAPFIRLNLDICPGLVVDPGFNICSDSPVELIASGYVDYTWSPSATLSASTGDTVLASPTGSTTYTVTGVNGSCTDNVDVTINFPAVLNMAGTNETSVGACDGTASANLSGGAAPFTYFWDVLMPGGSQTFNGTGGPVAEATTNQDFTLDVSGLGNLDGTMYDVQRVCMDITQDRGQDLDIFLISPLGTSVELSTDNGGNNDNYVNVCFDMSAATNAAGFAGAMTGDYVPEVSLDNFNTGQTANGTWTLRITEDSGVGTGPGSLNWWSIQFAKPINSTASSVASLCEGTYSVTTTDSKGCEVTGSITLPLSLAPVADFTASATSVCEGGSISFTDASQYSPDNWSWTFAGGTPATSTLQNPTVSYAAAGTYDVTLYVSNASGNDTKVMNGFITVNDNPVVTLTPTNVSCFGGTNGTITSSVTGGSGSNTYSWSNSATTANLSGLAAGTYGVTVSDINLCQGTASTTITQPATALSASIASTTPTNCFGSTDGQATVSATGGTAGYTYAWQGGGTDATKTGLAAGSYSVSVIDANGCLATTTANITSPTAVTANVAVTNVSCNGGNNGTATVTAAGGTPTYTYAWQGGGTDATKTNLTAGSYTVSVYDSHSCMTTANATITEPATLVATIGSQTNITCNGLTNGSATVSVAGGTAPFTYNWSSGSTTTVANNLDAMVYTVTVTDSKLCTASTSVTITEPAVLSASIVPTHVSCNGLTDGDADLTVTGGTTPYGYLWSNTSVLEDLVNVAAGNYSVTVTDNKGCQTNASTTINQPNAIVINIASQTNVSCNGGNDGTATISIAGGTSPYNTNWSSGGSGLTESGLSAATYTASVTDFNGCQATKPVTITQPVVLSASTTKTNVSCNGGNDGTATASAAGGTAPYSYAWPSGGTNALETGLAAGTFIVTVTDFNSCVTTASVTINQPSALAANISSVTNVSCFGGSNGNAIAAGAGGTPPYSYNWITGATTATASGLSAGNYSVTVQDSKGCQAITSATVSEPTQLVISTTGNAASCFGECNGSATVSIAGGTSPYSIIWDPSFQTAATATALCAGDVSVTVTDFNSCQAADMYTVTEPSAIVLNTTATDATCGNNDGSATVSISGGQSPFTVAWSSGGTDLTETGLLAGAYTVSVTDLNSCQEVTTASVNDAGAPTLNITAFSNVTCKSACDGSATVEITGGAAPYTILWNNGATDLSTSTLCAGNATVQVTDLNSCIVSKSQVITEPALLTASITGKVNVSCFGGANGQATASVSGGTTPYYYSWPSSNTAATETGLSVGSYIVSVADANGCATTATASISEPTQMIVSEASNVGVSCFGSTDGEASVSVIGGTPTYSYAWPSGGNSALETGLAGGDVEVTVTDINGCFEFLTISISEPTQLSASIVSSTDVSIAGGSDGSATADATGGTTPYAFSWQTGGTDATVSGLSAGSYNVTISDNNSCEAYATAIINEPGALVATLVSSANVTCNGACDGTATIDVQGGVTPYVIAWPDAQSTLTVTGLCANSYTVTVTDNNAVSTTVNVNITEPAVLSASITGQQDADCFGNASGRATVVATGGSLPYSYMWTSGYTNAAVTTLLAGSYDITVSDANGCLAYTSVSIGEPAQLTASIVSTDASCFGGNDGSADLTVSGGISTYLYEWSTTEASEDIAGLVAGNYDVIVTDANGCQAFAATTVGEPSALMVSILPSDVLCFGDMTGAADLSVSGGTSGYTFIWDNAETTEDLANLGTGTYNVTVVDANGCSATSGTSVGEPAILDASVFASDVTCFGAGDGSIDLTVNGGVTAYSFAWDNAETTEDLAGLAAGDYSVVVQDANGCTVSAMGSVYEPLALSIVMDSTDATTAISTDGSASAYVAGGNAPYSYNWSNGGTDQTITGLGIGIYNVTVTDLNGCEVYGSVEISFVDAIASTKEDMSITIYPNPNTGLFNIKMSGRQEDASLYIYNSEGQLVKFDKLQKAPGDNVRELDMSKQPKGVYMVKVTTRSKTKVERLIIK